MARIDTPALPTEALREALANAFIHRLHQRSRLCRHRFGRSINLSEKSGECELQQYAKMGIIRHEASTKEADQMDGLVKERP